MDNAADWDLSWGMNHKWFSFQHGDFSFWIDEFIQSGVQSMVLQTKFFFARSFFFVMSASRSRSPRACESPQCSRSVASWLVCKTKVRNIIYEPLSLLWNFWCWLVVEKAGREVWVQSEREFFFQETAWSEIQSFFGWKDDRQSTHESRFERCEHATFFWHRPARWKGRQKVSATIWCGVVRQSNSFFCLLALRWSYAVLSWQRFVSLCEEKLPKAKGAE